MPAVHAESTNKDNLLMESPATAGNELLIPTGIYKCMAMCTELEFYYNMQKSRIYIK